MESESGKQFIITDKNERIRRLKEYQQADHSGIKCGLNVMDRYIRLDKKQLTVLTGKSNIGKSTFATFYTYLMNTTNGFKTLFFSFEDSQEFYENELMKMYQDMGKMLDSNYFVDTQKITDIEDIEEAIKQANETAAKPIDIVIIDPFSYIPKPPIYNTNTVGDMVIKLKQWAQQYNLILILIAHPTKIMDDMDVKGVNISDSKNFRQLSDNVLCINPTTDKNTIKVTTDKIRHKEQGEKQADFYLQFSPQDSTFAESYKEITTDSTEEALNDIYKKVEARHLNTTVTHASKPTASKESISREWATAFNTNNKVHEYDK